MISTAPKLLTPPRLVWVAALITALVVGVSIPLLAGLKLQMLVILVLAFAGLSLVVVIPQRRILLVCAWIFVHPLSLEKVFSIFPQDLPAIFPPMLVISGDDLILYTLVLVMLGEALFTNRKVFFWSGVITPFALLAGWAAFIFSMNGAPTSNSMIQLMHWMKMLLFLFVFSSAIRSRDELLVALATVAVAVFLQASILGVSYVLDRKFSFSAKISGAPMMGFSGGGGNVFTRATGTVGHVNQQAMYHTFFTIPLAALFMVRNWIWRSFIAVVILGSFVAVILTFSRASWIACSLAAAVVFLLAWRNGRISPLGWVGIGVGALGALLVLGAFSGLILKRLTKGDDGATSSRLRAALVALAHVNRHPITGVGPGRFVDAQLERSPLEWTTIQWLPRGVDTISRDAGGLELQHVFVQGRWSFAPGLVHNKFLMTAAELGLVGLALFLWFQWRVFRRAFIGLGSSDPLLWWCAAFLLAAFCASQTEYMLEHFYDDKAMLAPLFVIALIIILGRIVSAEIPRERVA